MTTPVEVDAEPVALPQPHSHARGTAALVLGILGLLSVILPYLGLPLAIAAVVLSTFQKTRDRQANEVAHRQTNAGRVLGIIGIVLNGLVIAFFLIAAGLVWLAR